MVLSDSVLPRRQMFTMAAGVAVAGAAGVLGAASLLDPSAAAGRWQDGIEDLAGSMLVRLRDPAAGVLDLFVGAERIEVRDPDLAARIIAAARR